jgi:hypothetical protein
MARDEGKLMLLRFEQGQSLLSIVRRDEQDRKARLIDERTCFWPSRLASPCIPERFTIKA